MVITLDGDDIAEITMDGDEIVEVTMDGEVVWQAGGDGDWRANTTVHEDFESYDSQADLEDAWDFGVAPAAYELNASDPIAHEQDIVAAQDTAHAPNESITTPWGTTWSAVVRPGHGDNSPGVSVQHQPNWGSRLDDCYWTQADFQNDQFRILERDGGSTTVIGSASLPSDLSTANRYRIQVDLRDSDNNVRSRLYNYGDAPSETPIANTGWSNPTTVHSGGHIMLDAGREGAGNAQFDNVREHPAP